MTAEIFKFNGMTTVDLEPDDVLEAAKGKLQEVLIIGIDENAKIYIASTTGNVSENLLKAKIAEQIFVQQGMDILIEE